MKIKLDVFDPGDQRLLPNPNYDPAAPLSESNFPEIVDPLCGWARWGCWWIDLPTIEEEYEAAARNRRTTLLNQALHLIALHQVAPPPWLAAAMLEKFKWKPRAARDVEKARKVTTKVEQIQANRSFSLSKKAIGDRRLVLDMSAATLERQLRIYREHEERPADKLP
jgi:hypothetical protein